MAIATSTAIIAGAAIAGGAAAYSASQARRSANQAQSSQDRATEAQSAYNERMAAVAEEQLGLSREQLALAKAEAARSEEAWGRYKSVFMPIEDELVKQIKEMPAEPPGLPRMLATVDRGYSDLEGNLRRTMGGRYQYGSGLERGAMERTELGRTRAKAGAVADLTNAWEQEKFNRMMQVAGFGRTSAPLMTTSGGYAGGMAGVGSAGNIYSNVAGSYGNQAASYANLVNQANQASANAWASGGQTAGNLMQMYLLTNAMNKTPQYPAYS